MGTPEKQLLVPEKMMETLLKRMHQETHAEADALLLLAKNFFGPKM